MADDESPLVQDILISTALMRDINDDSLYQIDFSDTIVQTDDEAMFSSFDLFSMNYTKEEEIGAETSSTDQFLSNSSFDFPLVPDTESSSPSIFVNCSQQIVPSYSPPTNSNSCSYVSLSFSNPPEPIYHVRYVSELTSSPLNGNIVNTKKTTKKNVSGRYLKGTHGRYVTIDLPTILLENNDYYIRVTRLTVPYQNISFIHPYPLLYSPPKKKTNSNVIMTTSSIYYKLNREDIHSRSKRFPNLILARLKQCQIKNIDTLALFDNSAITYPFIGQNAKHKIANYQLKQSQLDFRLVVKSIQTDEFIDLGMFCRSNPLLEEEGTECKKLSNLSSLQF